MLNEQANFNEFFKMIAQLLVKFIFYPFLTNKLKTLNSFSLFLKNKSASVDAA